MRMDELIISGKRYISTRRAGKEHHYHSDYIGQLIRAGKVAGQKVGRAWYVSEASLAAHLRREATNTSAKAMRETAAESQTPLPQSQYTFVNPKESSDNSEVLVNTMSRAAHPENTRGPIASLVVPEPKLLKYISEKENARVDVDENEGMPRLQKDGKKNNASIEAARNLRTSGDRDYSHDYDRESEEDEMPVPLRISATPAWQPPYEPPPRYPAYYSREMAAGFAEPPLPLRRAGGRLLIVLALVSIVGMAGGFFLSSLPFIVAEEISY